MAGTDAHQVARGRSSSVASPASAASGVVQNAPASEASEGAEASGTTGPAPSSVEASGPFGGDGLASPLESWEAPLPMFPAEHPLHTSATRTAFRLGLM